MQRDALEVEDVDQYVEQGAGEEEVRLAYQLLLVIYVHVPP